MEKVVEIDGKPVKLRCTAVLPRLYRAKFGRDFFGDIAAIGNANEQEKADEQDKADEKPKRRKKKKRGASAASRTVTFIENLAYLMAFSGDPNNVPASIEEWLDSFDDPNAVLSVADEVLALYQLNNRTTSAPKKKNAP